jgi:hypothetical protein
MKKELILFALLFCCFSCALQKREIITKSTIKFEGKNTNIREFLEIDGYYQTIDYPAGYCLIFFEDGTYVSFSLKRDILENEIKANMSKSIKNWIDDKQIRWGTYWGVYKIENDTLIVYYYDEGSFGKGWSFYETRYKIMNKTFILPIYSRGRLKPNEQYDENLNISPWIKNGSVFYFSPADSLPSSDCWLKEEKWIWRNEQDWENYMKMIKQKKNNKQ